MAGDLSTDLSEYLSADLSGGRMNREAFLRKSKDVLEWIQPKLNNNTIIESINYISPIDGNVNDWCYPEFVHRVDDRLTYDDYEVVLTDGLVRLVIVRGRNPYLVVDLRDMKCPETTVVTSSHASTFTLLVPEDVKVRFFSSESDNFHRSFRNINFTHFVTPYCRKFSNLFGLLNNNYNSIGSITKWSEQNLGNLIWYPSFAGILFDDYICSKQTYVSFSDMNKVVYVHKAGDLMKIVDTTDTLIVTCPSYVLDRFTLPDNVKTIKYVIQNSEKTFCLSELPQVENYYLIRYRQNVIVDVPTLNLNISQSFIIKDGFSDIQLHVMPTNTLTLDGYEVKFKHKSSMNKSARNISN